MVDEVGPSVRHLAVGDRVMVPFNIFCGTCWFCTRGLYSNCHNVNPNATAVGGIYGYSHTAFDDDVRPRTRPAPATLTALSKCMPRHDT